MIKLITNFNITANQIVEWFDEFMETYPNGYKGHTINEHNGLYDVTIAYDDTAAAPANLVENSTKTVRTSSKKGGEIEWHI